MKGSNVASVLEKAGIIGFDIKKLASRRDVLEGEVERLEKKIIKDTNDAEKTLTQLAKDNEDILKVREREVAKKEALIEKKLKTISLREEVSEVIEEDRKKLNYDKFKIAQKEKELDANNIKCLEMTDLAKLRAEQLATTLKDLGKKPKDLKVKEPVKKKKK